MPASKNVNKDFLADGVEQLMRLKKLWSKQVLVYGSLIQRFEGAIEELEPDVQMILKRRYLDNMCWDDIIDSVPYERSAVFNMHRKALDQICCDEE